MKPLRLMTFAFLLLGLTAPAQAQGDGPRYLGQGDMLRIWTHAGESTTGTLTMMDAERLRLMARNDLVREFALVDVGRLEVSVGRRRGGSTVLGAGAGLVAGILFGAAISSSPGSGGGGVNLAVIGLPLVMTPVGALLGALMAPHRYVSVSPPYRMASTAPGR